MFGCCTLTHMAIVCACQFSLCAYLSVNVPCVCQFCLCWANTSQHEANLCKLLTQSVPKPVAPGMVSDLRGLDIVEPSVLGYPAEGLETKPPKASVSKTVCVDVCGCRSGCVDASLGFSRPAVIAV